jgi:hypothetical protein
MNEKTRNRKVDRGDGVVVDMVEHLPQCLCEKCRRLKEALQPFAPEHMNYANLPVGTECYDEYPNRAEHPPHEMLIGPGFPGVRKWCRGKRKANGCFPCANYGGFTTCTRDLGHDGRHMAGKKWWGNYRR